LTEVFFSVNLSVEKKKLGKLSTGLCNGRHPKGCHSDTLSRVVQSGVIQKSKPMPRPIKYIPRKMTKLGEYLKKLREELGMSIRQVAEKTNLAPSYISKIESGKSFKTIGVETLIRFSKLYDIPLTAILKEAGFLENIEDNLPELPQYLRQKYQLTPPAIRDMEMAKEIVDRKYQRQ